MKTINLSFISLILILIGTGCAGVSKKNCAGTDWKQQGVIDGKKGQAATEILKTEKMCQAKKVDFPILAYKEGWVEGVKEYCSPENGFKLSSTGKKVNVVNCPIEYQPSLVESIKKGEEFLKVEKNIVKTEKAKENMKEKRDEVKADISDANKKLDNLKAEKEKMLTPESN